MPAAELRPLKALPRAERQSIMRLLWKAPTDALRLGWRRDELDEYVRAVGRQHGVRLTDHDVREIIALA